MVSTGKTTTRRHSSTRRRGRAARTVLTAAAAGSLALAVALPAQAGLTDPPVRPGEGVSWNNGKSVRIKSMKVGNGAACSSSEHKASRVLLAMGLTEEQAFSSVRVSVGKDNTAEEIEGFLGVFSTAVGRLRELSPLYAG